MASALLISIVNLLLMCSISLAEVSEKFIILYLNTWWPKTENHKDPAFAAVKAALYIDSRKDAWGDFTPRALIALSYVQFLTMSESEKITMWNKLNIDLLKILQQGVSRIPLHKLALYSNALYSTCQDPRSFFGVDLVELLRVQTDEAMKSDFNLPIVILTLCLAKETRLEDYQFLLKMYDGKNDRVGFKALVVIAMAACQSSLTRDLYEEIKARSEDFEKRFRRKENTGLYSKALIYQALNAWKYDTTAVRDNLLQFQAEDGSFQNVVTTYAAIPALVNSSLADLQCKSRKYEVKRRQSATTSVQLYSPESHVYYTVVIPDGENVGNHSLLLPFQNRKSLYELMKIAAEKNPMYRFSCDELKDGKKVNAMAGVTNDAETGASWQLYKQSKNSNQMVKETGEIEYVFPQDEDKFVFIYEYNDYQ